MDGFSTYRALQQRFHLQFSTCILSSCIVEADTMQFIYYNVMMYDAESLFITSMN